MLTWISVVGVLARNQLLRVIRSWYFSCDDQQRALRDSEETMFCEQEPAVGFFSMFCSGLRFDYLTRSYLERLCSYQISEDFVVDSRATGNTALSSPCWDLLALMRRVVNYHSS
ncbi:hypothetical protein F511_28403 [Dorcoceras hygrometricum]|uniref:Uncharacterized protein n=1 Tax=Dorcoceras hygrometricum TaxID=472368 RepID=A0A2Z7AH37_9LAMI|nr:hypothetical protein F511_28403 [Dorcoceras hygrometricum]